MCTVMLFVRLVKFVVYTPHMFCVYFNHESTEFHKYWLVINSSDSQDSWFTSQLHIVLV